MTKEFFPLLYDHVDWRIHIDRAIVSGRRVSIKFHKMLASPESRSRFRHDLLESNYIYMSRKFHEKKGLHPISLKEYRDAEKAIGQIRKQLQKFPRKIAGYVKRTSSTGNETIDPIENIDIALSTMELSVRRLAEQKGQAGHPGNKNLHFLISEIAKAIEHLTGLSVPKSFDIASGEFVNLDLEILFAVVSSLEPECNRSDITTAMRK